jgi:hypothetical protein
MSDFNSEEKNQLSEVEQLFAEEQLKVNSDATVDFPYVIDDMNQEDVYDVLIQQGYSPEQSLGYIDGIDFGEQVRQDTVLEGTSLAQFQTSEAIEAGHMGNFFAPLEEDLDRRTLGIENENPETQNRMLQVYQTNEDISDALVSTAKSIEDWNDSGEVFPGGGQQIFISDADKDNVSLEYPADVLLPVLVDTNLKDNIGSDLDSQTNTNPHDDISSDLDYQVNTNPHDDISYSPENEIDTTPQASVDDGGVNPSFDDNL